uniref:Uncharacterized protein n=1 Tax=Anguilla anguilla TaxID=7936 RepID=A0A0E9QK05_ANGAN
MLSLVCSSVLDIFRPCWCPPIHCVTPTHASELTYAFSASRALR